MSITLLELRTQSRQRADQEDSTFITDTELNSYINNSIAELHDILVQAYGSDYFLSEFNFTTVPDQTDYTLPEDLYKLRGVDVKLNSANWETIRKFNFNERNRLNDFGVWNISGFSAVRYRVMGSRIRFSPVPDAAVQARLWYVPVAEVLVSDSDELVDYNAYSEYVIVDAAIKMMVKEESDPTVLVKQKADLKRRIEEAANNRDAGNPESVTDVYAENNDYFWRNSSS
jgi:hypothetical protein